MPPKKERFALIWVIALVVVFTIYFVVDAFQGKVGSPPIGLRIATLAFAMSTLGVIALLARYLVRPQEQMDERDRLIAARSCSVAYGVLMAGMCVVGVVMPFNKSGWDIIHAALLFIALAEIVQHGFIVFSYRRGLRA